MKLHTYYVTELSESYVCTDTLIFSVDISNEKTGLIICESVAIGKELLLSIKEKNNKIGK